MTERRFTMYGDMANIKQWILDRKDNSRMSSKWEMLDKLNELAKENEQLKQEIKNLRLLVLDSIKEADEIQCTCNPCVVEECVKKVVE